MGSGRDKRKKLKPSAPGTGQAKTERKTAAAEAKRTRRADRATADEDDVDALLARIKLEDAAATEVIVEEDCQPPCGRANASLACVPAPSTGPVRPGEVLLYGGECVDSGGKTRVFGDLYRFEAGKRRWSRIKSPGQPPPRSAHQAAVHRNFMYVFGGEFTSPNQVCDWLAVRVAGPCRRRQGLRLLLAQLGLTPASVFQERFHHYKDLWRLDITTWQWEQLLLRGAPSARRVTPAYTCIRHSADGDTCIMPPADLDTAWCATRTACCCSAASTTSARLSRAWRLVWAPPSACLP